jgi:hypothetical protein
MNNKEQEFYETYKDASQDELNQAFINACNDGKLEIVKYLLTSSKLNQHININVNNGAGFCLACREGHLEIVKYLLTSPDLKEHANIHIEKNFGFKMAYKYSHFDIITFLILEMNMEKTEHIEDFLRRNPNEEIDNMFTIIELKTQLEKDLSSDDKINYPKPKL